MTNAYCTLADIRSRLAGVGQNIGPQYDQVIADKILEVSADLDRQVAQARGISGAWSFLADSQYASWIVTLSAITAPTGGTFTLTHAGQTTAAIAYNAAASAVQSALEALTSIGAGNVVVAGAAGGPYNVTCAGTKTGPQTALTGTSALTGPATSITITVQTQIEAVAASPSERLFAAPAGGRRLLPIDDCVSIAAVKIYSSPGVLSRTLVATTDYLPWPLRGSPITGLLWPTGAWPELPWLIGVSSRWGYGTAVPFDVREATAIEVIRSYLGDKAGNDDRLGMTPFGAIITAKAFTSKLHQLVSDYSMGAGMLR